MTLQTQRLDPNVALLQVCRCACVGFVIEAVPGKIEGIWQAPRLCAYPASVN